MLDRYQKFNRLYGIDFSALVLRLGIAPIFIVDGVLKVLSGSGSWHPLLVPSVQHTVAWGELIAGAAIALGLLTRLASLGVMAIMIGAIVMRSSKEVIWSRVHAPGYENEQIILQGTGYELMLNYVVAAVALTLVLKGPGRFALDHLLFRRRHHP